MNCTVVAFVKAMKTPESEIHALKGLVGETRYINLMLADGTATFAPIRQVTGFGEANTLGTVVFAGEKFHCLALVRPPEKP